MKVHRYIETNLELDNLHLLSNFFLTFQNSHNVFLFPTKLSNIAVFILHLFFPQYLCVTLFFVLLLKFCCVYISKDLLNFAKIVFEL